MTVFYWKHTWTNEMIYDSAKFKEKHVIKSSLQLKAKYQNIWRLVGHFIVQIYSIIILDCVELSWAENEIVCWTERLPLYIQQIHLGGQDRLPVSPLKRGSTLFNFLW